jgi:hypothetical protein
MNIAPLKAWAIYYYAVALQYLHTFTGGSPMVWLLAIIGIPILVVLMLFFSMADDFWQLIRLRLDLSRIFGDLIHVLFIVGLGIVAEVFSLFMFIKDVL